MYRENREKARGAHDPIAREEGKGDREGDTTAQEKFF